MKLEELKDKKILIVGYGIEGKSTKEYLLKHFPDMEIGIADKTDGDDYLEKQEGYDLAIKSPSIPTRELTIAYTTATNIFMANAKGKVIGVTGTKGKSTTSTLIYEILKKHGADAHLGGNIGVPMLSFIDQLQDDSISVLELSSFQLSDATLSPHIAVLLMTAPEHLDYHVDINSYIEAKRNILRFQTPADYAILNKDYPATRESDLFTDAKIYWVGHSMTDDEKQGCFIQEKGIFLKMNGREEKILDTSEVMLKGRHNLENVCAAIAASLLAGATMKAIIPVLKTFKGLAYRLEYVGQNNGISYFNDSLATIPEATIGALEALGTDVETLIAGGHDRGLDYQELGKYIAEKTKIKTLILFPETGKKVWEEVVSETPVSTRPRKFETTSMDEAVQIASKNTAYGKICLLSPAASSFGLFKDYKDRGDKFKEAVESLTGA